MQCHWAAATLDILVNRRFFLLNQQNCGGLSASFSGQPFFFFFFWTSSRVRQQGYTPGYGGHEKGDKGAGAWVADAGAS